MLSLNVAEMQSHATELKRLIDSYEEYSMSIVQELKNSEVTWKDDNSDRFFSAISNQKNVVEKFISELKTVKDKYDSIVTEAHNISSGMNKIFANQQFKSVIMSRFDSAISSLRGIQNRLNNQYMSFCTYYERSTVYGIASEFGRMANRLSDAKDRVESLFNRLNTLETNITATLRKISISSIQKLDLSAFM